MYGMRINFSALGAPKPNSPFQIPMSEAENTEVDKVISSFLQRKIIAITNSNDGYFSHLFTRPKKDGRIRTILNLKGLNKHCRVTHFKMETIQNVKNMLEPGMYLASVDLQDAFYSIPIHPTQTKFFKFLWNGQQYEFLRLPNGYCDASRVFTKVLKVPFAILRQEGHLSVIYIDDSLLMGSTYQLCAQNVSRTVQLLQSLGFTLNTSKCELVPKQSAIFLGFKFDSVSMTIELTKDKKQRIFEMASVIANNPHVPIRKLSSLLGNIVAALPAIPYGKLNYRKIEAEKIEALYENAFNYESYMLLSQEALTEIDWWRVNIMTQECSLAPTPPVDYTIFTDASLQGWGAHDGHTTLNGRWSNWEKLFHINILELMAIKIAVTSLIKDTHIHIRIMSDNTTAISYINKMGGVKSMIANDIAKDIWNSCIAHGAWISAAHVPGVENDIADQASRQFQDHAEWMLDNNLFQVICDRWGTPSLDMFASRTNHKLDRYVSRYPDAEAYAVDCFSLDWYHEFPYLFPPFSSSLIWRIRTKIIQDEVDRAVLIVPNWVSQNWYPALMKMARDHIVIPSSRLVLPGTEKKHPMAPKLKLLALLI